MIKKTKSCYLKQNNHYNQTASIIKLPPSQKLHLKSKLPSLTTNSSQMDLNQSNKIVKIREKVLQRKLKQQPNLNIIYEQLIGQLQHLANIKQKLNDLHDIYLNRKLQTQFLALSNGKLLLLIWKFIFELLEVSEERRVVYKKIDVLQQQSGVAIDEDVLSGLQMMRNMGKYRIAEYKRARLKKRQTNITKSETKMRQTLFHVTQNLSIISTPSIKNSLIKSVKNLNNSQISTQKNHYKQWKKQALNVLSKTKNIKCEILKAEIFLQSFNS